MDEFNFTEFEKQVYSIEWNIKDKNEDIPAIEVHGYKWKLKQSFMLFYTISLQGDPDDPYFIKPTLKMNDKEIEEDEHHFSLGVHSFAPMIDHKNKSIKFKLEFQVRRIAPFVFFDNMEGEANFAFLVEDRKICIKRCERFRFPPFFLKMMSAAPNNELRIEGTDYDSLLAFIRDKLVDFHDEPYYRITFNESIRKLTKRFNSEFDAIRDLPDEMRSRFREGKELTILADDDFATRFKWGEPKELTLKKKEKTRSFDVLDIFSHGCRSGFCVADNLWFSVSLTKEEDDWQHFNIECYIRKDKNTGPYFNQDLEVYIEYREEAQTFAEITFQSRFNQFESNVGCPVFFKHREWKIHPAAKPYMRVTVRELDEEDLESNSLEFYYPGKRDVKIIAKGRDFYVCKDVLIKYSTFFKEYFTDRTIADDKPHEMRFEDFDHQLFAILLDIIYNKSKFLTVDQVEPILVLSLLLGCDKVVDYIEDGIIKSLHDKDERLDYQIIKPLAEKYEFYGLKDRVKFLDNGGSLF